jgi:hypothetical protein
MQTPLRWKPSKNCSYLGHEKKYRSRFISKLGGRDMPFYKLLGMADGF